MATTTDTPHIYVACLASYNAGTLHGEWIDADQSAEELHEAIRAMLAESPEPGAEEWAIHDYDNFGGWSPGEWESLDEVAAMAAGLEEHGEAFAAFVDYSGLEPSEAADSFSDAYCGKWSSEREYAENLVDDLGMLSQVPENLRYYFDYDRFARENLFISDYRFVNGYVFHTDW